MPGTFLPLCAVKHIEESSGLMRDCNAACHLLDNICGMVECQIRNSRHSAPNPDPLASIRYSCVSWVDHLDESEPASVGSGLQAVDAIDEFIQTKYLYLLESLSLLRSMSEGVMAVQKLESIARSTNAQQLLELLRDARRFILSHKRPIELAPLQVYASALVFSPNRSIVRGLFKKGEPDWVTLKPIMESAWNACLQTLEGHSDRVTSVVFSPDGQRLASGSDDGEVKVWDAETGACVQTLEIGREISYISFSPTNNSLLSTNIGIFVLAPHGMSRSGYGIAPDGIWIVKDGCNYLWIPPDYRALASAVAENTIALGCHSGRVLPVKFSEGLDTTPRIVQNLF